MEWTAEQDDRLKRFANGECRHRYIAEQLSHIRPGTTAKAVERRLARLRKHNDPTDPGTHNVQLPVAREMPRLVPFDGGFYDIRCFGPPPGTPGVKQTVVPTGTGFVQSPRPMAMGPMQRHQIGVFSDTHLGSDYALPHELKKFIHDAYDQGVRTFLCPGDLVEGLYDHARWEATQGFEKQAKIADETLPQLPGLTYRKIPGNHDETLFKVAGIDPGRYLQDYFTARGRKDLFCYSMRDALLNVHGLIVNLHHPTGGGSLGAHIGRMNRKIDAYPQEQRVDLLIAGHWHEFAMWERRGTTAILAPCFQGSGGPYSATMTTPPALGGLVISWSTDEKGLPQDIAVERRAIRETRQIHVIAA
jgi:predicted phosphodiesterase